MYDFFLNPTLLILRTHIQCYKVYFVDNENDWYLKRNNGLHAWHMYVITDACSCNSKIHTRFINEL